jgi:DNA-binding response OmpR family regulator
LTHGNRIRLADSDVTLVFRQESPSTVTVDLESPSVDETWVRKFSDEEVSLGEDAVPPIFGKDSDLFRFLRSKQGEVVSREDIARRLWPELMEGGLADQVIDEAIARIRAHVEKDPKQPEHLISIGESGFLLV